MWTGLRGTALVAVAVSFGRVAAAGQAQLPVPCFAGACNATTTFLTPVLGSSVAPKVTAVQSGNTLTINQLDNQAILNWSSFNVSANGKVIFDQPSATAVALNRIFQTSPSTIFGQVSANGQIYLINPNGFVFGRTAEVNAAGLIASTLGITDNVFSAGLLAPQILSGSLGSKAALSGNVGADGNPLPGGDPSTATIVVESGAQMSTPGGRMLLAAPTVENAGSLSAPDGQVVLAGGQNVYLLASTNPDLRGLIVEVDGNNATAMNQMTTATNESTGVISTPRGNIWMVGLAVNQNGRLSATTSVSLNGSVHLEAGSNALVQGGGGNNAFTVTAQTGGTLTLGPQSGIDILPELSSTATAVPDQVQSPSQITLLGQAIDMHDASITAPNGTLLVTAAAAPGLGVQTAGNALAQIRVDAGTSIDLSGSSVELPVTANLLAIQLRANELADDPAQRNGPLHGQTVYVDARVGSPLINEAAFQSALDAVPESVGQRTESGGSAAFESEGDVVIAPGATINVSGGHTAYEGGVFQTSLLVGTDGQLYNVGTANPSLSYTGVLNPTFTQTYNKWGVQDVVNSPGLSHYESGYVEGAAAGTVSIAAPSVSLQGTLIGTATNGALQRANPVSGGQLIIGLPGGLSTSPGLDFLVPSVAFVAEETPLVVSDNAPLPPQTLQLSTNYLTAGGFTSTKIYSNGPVTLPVGLPLNLNPGGSLLIDSPRITIDSNITSTGGEIQLENSSTVGVGPGIPRLGIDIGGGVTLDVSGQWTNDYALGLTGTIGSGQLRENGGTIILSPGLGAGIGNSPTGVTGTELVLGDDVALRANGGAWLQVNGQLSGGTGGSISVLNAPLQAAFQVGTGDQIEAFGVDGAAGGSFSLTVPRVLIGAGSSAWTPNQRVDDLAPAAGTAPGGVFAIGSALFDRFGFDVINLNANGAVPAVAPTTDIMTVAAGTAITPLTETLQLQPGYLHESTGASLAGFTQVATLPVGTRPVANISLNAAPTADDPSLTDVGLLDVQAGSSIVADPGASIALSGVGGILDNGTLRARGGTITLTTEAPLGTPDPGYLPKLTLDLGPQAMIDASGTFVPTLNAQNLLLGSVLGGGTVELVAERGSVITEPGSEIDVDGASHLLDVATGGSSKSYTLYEFPSAGGSLLARAPESISLLGNFDAHTGSGNYGDPAGGALEVDLTRSEYFSYPADPTLAATFPTTPRVIELVSAVPSNATPSTPGSGQALLSVSELGASGIDSLRLVAGDEILFSTNLPLALTRQLILDSPSIAVSPGLNAAVTTNYAALGNSLALQGTALAAPGGGNLDINAQQIDLVGSFVLQTANAHLSSAGDITLRDVYAESSVFGNLNLDGNLTLSAERVYPATGSSFAIATVHSPVDSPSMVDTVTITPNGASPGFPLSAGGSVSISADQITSSGSLLAPYGTISLTAVDSVNLAHGSLTSVSGSGLVIPYGATEFGGQEWFYTPQGGAAIPITGTPARTVSLNAPTINVASGATVNLRGGGDLYAYEWVPGTGGTIDALGQNAANGLPSIPGLYAVLPSTRGQYAPYDPEETPLSQLSAGASIYLSGGGGLAAGIYPLLPARDALVPGTFLVQVQGTGYGTIVPGQLGTLVDGTPVVAGYLTFGTTGLHTGGYEGVAVWPGSYGQSLAQYLVTDGSTFFGGLAATAASNAAPGVTLPHILQTADAGTLSIDVSTALNFLGQVEGNAPGSSGVSSSINLSAPELVVTAAASGVRSPGVVTIAGSVIQGWNAGEVVLGGEASADGTSIAVTANSVSIEDGARTSANEVILVANQSIDVQGGASVLSTSATAGGAAPAALPATTPLTLTGTNASGAAMLAVSDLELPILQRSGGATSGATINLEHGSTVGSLGALSLDAPGGIVASGTLVGTGASWSLASSSIGFVGSGKSADALQIDSSLESALGHADAIRLASDGAIDLYGPVLLGVTSSTSSPSLSTLTLAASSLVNQGAASGSVFGAKTLTLEGANATATSLTPTAAAGGGSLTLVAGEVDVGTGALTIDGFQDTSIHASSAVVGQEVGAIATGGNMSISTPTLTAVSLAQMGLSAPFGTLAVGSAGTSSAKPAIANDLGGEVDLSGSSIQLSSAIVVPAGVVTGQATQDINVGSGAVIDTSGRSVVIGGHSFGAEGGAITLAAGGNLTLAAGSSLNVSGAGDSPAGAITLDAGGAASVLAVLSGHAPAGAEGGTFAIDAGSLAQGLTPLASSLQTGGFTAADSIIAHAGNLALSAGTGLTANQILLVADTGSIEIDAPLSAPNAGLRGTIGVYGGAGVTLDSNAALNVNSTGSAVSGGEIDLGANAGGAIVLDPGSRLSAAGSSAGGTLLVRAPVTGTDVALTNAGATLSGFGQILVEPIITMPIGTTLGPNDLANIEAAAATTVAAVAPSIEARLNPSGALPLSIRPAVDLTQSGSLTLANSLDLYPYSSAGAPLDVFFRVGGSITVGSVVDGTPSPTTISDGFNASGPLLVLSQSPSSSFRLVAGADASSPDPLALVAGSGANLTLEPGSIIRTGTGEIDLSASGNIVFAAPGAAGGNAPLVYTAGIEPLNSAGQSIAGIAVGTSGYVFNFPTQGGAIRVNAGADIQGAAVQESVTAWQLREGYLGTPAQWGVDLDQLGWNITSLGGGDVSVQAVGSISELSVAAADSLYHPKHVDPLYIPSGGLQVSAGGDIGSSQFFLADGTSLLRAGGAFSAVEPVQGDSTNVGSSLALDNSQFVLEARTGITIDAIYNPSANTETLLDPGEKLLSYFFTYGGESAVTLQSTGGVVLLNEDSLHENALLGAGAGVLEGNAIYPGTLNARSLLLDVSVPTAIMFPSTSGQLELVAGRDLMGNGTLSMADAALDSVPSTTLTAQDPSTLAAAVQVPFSADLHVNDPFSALILAGRDTLNVALQLPKPAEVIAGRDISNLQYEGQNLNVADLTLVSAGRDVIDTVNGGSEGIIQVGGPGRLDVLAGRNVDLGFSSGITTVGDTANPNLPTATGADLTVVAGLGQAAGNYASFVNSIISPNSADQRLLVTYVESLTGQTGLSYTTADTQFAALSADQQRPLIDQVFFNTLSASGLQANTDPQAGYALGYIAIDALFPNSRTASANGPSPYQGDISLTFSRIYTLSGGAISLLAPGGEIDVGLANPPANLSENKTPAQLGIVAQGPGDVSIYTKGDVNVNSSRIFTLGGGNILIWSDEGSIDAGRGSKSSVSAPPPQVLVDSSGNITLSFSGAVAGSGIRTIQIDPSVNPGNVNLVAPEGTVNAGDAGIGAAGNINIAALHVVGLDNITFGGNATGVPAQVSNIGVSLAGASGTASAASNSSTNAATSNAEKEAAAAPLSQAALSWLDVFVTGLGEENCKPDDIECLKRQKTATH
jgi:filamentous hemagglutinin family protein